MRSLLLFLLLVPCALALQTATPTESSAVVVVTMKWAKARQVADASTASDSSPAPEMTAAKKNNNRSARANDPSYARDPDADTIDSRSAAIDKIEQQSRSRGKNVDGFAYNVKVRNTSSKGIEFLFWEYQFIDPVDQTSVTHRQFLCNINLKPDKEKELQGFSTLGPSDVINAGAANPGKQLQENIVINRVEYTDGSTWQRKDWKATEIRMAYRRAMETPWSSGMCRRL